MLTERVLKSSEIFLVILESHIPVQGCVHAQERPEWVPIIQLWPILRSPHKQEFNTKAELLAERS